mgnify:CR=1 FL=1
MGLTIGALALLGLLGIPAVPWLISDQTALLAVSLTTVWLQLGLNTVILLAGMQGIPTEQYEAAQVDGATAIQRFFFITLPSLRHVIMITCLLSLIWTSNTFEMVYLLTGGGPSNRTEVFTVLTYKLGVQNARLGEAAAVPMPAKASTYSSLAAGTWSSSSSRPRAEMKVKGPRLLAHLHFLISS